MRGGVLLLLATLLPHPCWAASPGETAALRALYQATAKPPPNAWRRSDNWMTGDPCSGWYGVTCTGGQVTRLALRNNNLRGNIPANVIGRLPNLQHLDLAHNPMLTGNFPTGELALLSKLTFYAVGDDNTPGLTGPFPDWNSLPKPGLLQGVEVWGDFTGAFPSVAQLTAATSLRVDHTRITGTVPDLTALTNMLYLYIEDNDALTGTIPSMASLGKARTVIYHNNAQTGTIPDLTPLRSVTDLRIQWLDISGTVPGSLSSLDKLTWLSFAHNCRWYCDLSGTLPPLHSALRGTLERLYLHTNAFEGLPALVPRPTNLNKLKYFHFYENMITGTFPCHASAYPALIELRMEHNKLTGTLPCLDDFQSITSFRAGENDFTGTIPQLTRADALLVLDLNNNGFSGTIPQTFVNSLTKIQELTLGGNELSGTMPALANNPDLHTLHFHRNAAKVPLQPTAVTAGNANTPTDFSPLFDGDPRTVYQCTVQCEILIDFGKEVCMESMVIQEGPDTRVAAGGTFSLPSITQYQSEKCVTGVHVYQGSLGPTLNDLREPMLWNWERCCDWNWYTCRPGTARVLGKERIYDNPWGDSEPFCQTKTRYYRLQIHDCASEAGVSPDQCRIGDISFTTEGERMSGTIPDLSSVPKLNNLWAYGNDLTGTLPLAPGQNTWESGNIRVDSNRLEGALPPLCPTLEHGVNFYIDNNRFTGTIPDITCFSWMKQLRIGENQLTGTIPHCDCTSLWEFLADGMACCPGWEQEWLRSHASAPQGSDCPRCGGPSPWPDDCDTPFTTQHDCPWPTAPPWGAARQDPCKHEWPGGGLEGPLPDFADMPLLIHFGMDNNKLRGPLSGRNTDKLTSLYWFRARNNRIAGTLPLAEMNQGAIDHGRGTDVSWYLDNNSLWGTVPDVLFSLSRSKHAAGHHHGGHRNDGRRFYNLQVSSNHLWGRLPGHFELVQYVVRTHGNCWNCPLTPQGVYDEADGPEIKVPMSPPVQAQSGSWWGRYAVPAWARCRGQAKDACSHSWVWVAANCAEPPAERHPLTGPSCPAEAANSLYESTARCSAASLECDRVINEDDIRRGASLAAQFARSRWENGAIVEATLPFFAPGLWDCPPTPAAGPLGPGAVALTAAQQQAVRDSMVSRGSEPAGFNALKGTIAPPAAVQLGPVPGADPYVDLPTELWLNFAAAGAYDISVAEVVDFVVPPDLLLAPFGYAAPQALNFTIVPSPGVAATSWLPGGMLDELDLRFATSHQLGRHVNATWTLAAGETFTCATPGYDCIDSIVVTQSAVAGGCTWDCAKDPVTAFARYDVLACSPRSITVDLHLFAYDLPDGGTECVNVSLAGACTASGFRPCQSPVHMCIISVTEPGPTPTPSIQVTRTPSATRSLTQSPTVTHTRPFPTPTPTPSLSPTATITLIPLCMFPGAMHSTLCVEGDIGSLPILLFALLSLAAALCAICIVALYRCRAAPVPPPPLGEGGAVPDADEFLITARLPEGPPPPKLPEMVRVRARVPSPEPPPPVMVTVAGVPHAGDITVSARTAPPATPPSPEAALRKRGGPRGGGTGRPRAASAAPSPRLPKAAPAPRRHSHGGGGPGAAEAAAGAFML
eukprot:TRINITY_DN31927_c0_g1_i1.p1 TRINITY_DN31927_c0_g1~~TRINITY_DN31927_c0_g1_i1.p1  ORF type:complete len:1601 (+),score=368.16 TRINITY_DN31927_c0_g1_i1:224-5026(+)